MRIHVYNSFSRVENLTVQQYQALRKVLSYSVSASEAFYSKARSPIRYLLSPKGEFMTGLLPRVQLWAQKSGIPVTIENHRVCPNPKPGMFRLKDFGARFYQKAAVATLCDVDRGGAEMVTGSGKSLTMALLINALQLKTLVIVPNLTLKAQLQEIFKRVFYNTDNITVENIDSPTLKSPGNYDALILDETHHAAASTYRQLNKKAWTNIYRRYFFSGTFFRSQDEESILLEGIAGRPTFKFGYKEAVEAGAVVPIEAYYYVLPKQEMKGNEANYQSVYSELVVNNKLRNTIVATLLGRLHSTGVSTLCLVKELKHGRALSDLTYFPFANGEDGFARDMIDSFVIKNSKTLIATTGVCGEGVDTKPAEYLLITGGGKAKTQFMQMVGRILRPSPGKQTGKVILFKDPSNKYLVKHFNQCVRHLEEEYGVKPTQLTY